MRLRIKRWAETYEVSGREIPKKGLRFFGFPVDAEGLGWRRLSSMEDGRGAAYFACFIQMLCATARLDSERRGLVVREDGTPYTPETLYMRFGLCSRETWAEAVAFFADPAIGWLVDEEAQAQAAQPSKVLAMPLPKIEEPSIYEAAADRMIAAYLAAGADKGKVMRQSLVASALVDRLESMPSAHHAEAIALIEDNIVEMLEAAKDLSKILRLDNFLRSGPCLLPRTGPKKYQRGSVEALIQTEVLAGRMTAEDARKQGVEL